MNSASIIQPAAALSGRPRPSAFRRPKPSLLLMWLLGLVNRWGLVRGYFRVQKIDLPRADRVRLQRAASRNTAAFLGPNHPEFGLDWMMDKEISTRVAPRMASWAAHDVIDSAPGFWTRNNLVANNGGEAATEYSVGWALKGHGVLVHPEGMVHWTGNKVHPLFHGIAEMACEAARVAAREGVIRPVYVVPIVWKFRYTHDVSAGIHREMEAIETELHLRRHSGASVSERFLALQENLLARQMAAFGFNRWTVHGLDFFNRQDSFRAHLVADLQSRYAVQLSDSMDRTINRLERAIVARRRDLPDDAGLAADFKKVKEAERLGGFSRDVYGTPMLSQEQIFECLKRHRATLMRTGFRNALHNLLPRPYGARVAHVRVPEPILVDPVRASGDEVERKAYVIALIEQAQKRMQVTLDAINREIAADVRVLSHPNPFAVRPMTEVTLESSRRLSRQLVGGIKWDWLLSATSQPSTSDARSP